MGFVGDLMTGGAPAANKTKVVAPQNKFSAREAYIGEKGHYLGDVDTARGQMGDAYGQAQGAGQEQSEYSKALWAQMRGEGPSLAQGQLRSATDRTNALTAGTIASQRGLNPALAQRLILQNQAAANQEAAGQSAQVRAQEQLAATQLLGGALAQRRAQDIEQQRASEALYGTAGGLQQQANALDVQNYQQTQALNADVAARNQQAQMQAAEANAQIARDNAAYQQKNQQQAAGAILGGLGSAAGMLGGPVGSAIGGALGTAVGGGGGKYSGGEIDYRSGGYVPGRARVDGDSPENDTQPAVLSPGEIVLPRSVTKAPDAENRAAEFVAAIRRHKAVSKPKASEYAQLLETQKEINERLMRLESAMCYGGMVKGGK